MEKKLYRCYVLDVTNALAPVAHVAYASAVRYDAAWKIGRAALDADKRGKAVVGYPSHVATIYTDEACTKLFASHGKTYTFVRADDMTARNKKIDVTALRAALANTDTAAALAAVKKALNVQ